MARSDDDALRSLAGAIADGREVDWGAHRDVLRDMAGTVDALRAIESVARVYGNATGPDGDEARGAPDAGGRDAEPTLFRWGSLLVREKLGEGSFGAVYRAWDPALGRHVAVKLRPVTESGSGSARRWLAEAKRLARVRHPNVVAAYGAGVHEERAGIVTELLRGETLEARLADHGPMSAREAALIGIDLCSALAAVHEAGLVHGDVKASNVIREHADPASPGAPTGAGRIVLTDFGAAFDSNGQLVDRAAATPLACAPEVLRGAAPSVASDIYALGVLLFLLVSGRYPVEAVSLPDLEARHESGRRLALREARPELPPEFIAAVERALSADPLARFASASAMENALETVLRVSPAKRATRTRWWAAAAMVLAVAGAAAFAVAFRAAREPSNSAGASPTSPGSGGAPPGRDASPGSVTQAASTEASPDLDVSACLFRAAADVSEPLDAGSRVRPGEHLFLQIDGRDPLHVYVLNEDRRGVFAVLFPLPDLDMTNPIPAGRHRLPGPMRGRDFDWQVTSAGGEETFLVLASKNPLAGLSAGAEGAVFARVGQAIEPEPALAQAAGRYRGVTGLTPSLSPSGATSGGRLAALAESLSTIPRSDLRYWLIRIDNSGR